MVPESYAAVLLSDPRLGAVYPGDVWLWDESFSGRGVHRTACVLASGTGGRREVRPGAVSSSGASDSQVRFWACSRLGASASPARGMVAAGGRGLFGTKDLGGKLFLVLSVVPVSTSF